MSEMGDGAPAASAGEARGATEVHCSGWLTGAGKARRIVEDGRRARPHPPVPADIPGDGFVDRVETGKRAEAAPAAAAAGEAR